MANYDEEQEKGESGLDRAGEEAGRYAGDKVKEKLSGKGAKEAGKGTAKQVAKEGGKKVGKEGAKRSLQAATAAETAGIGPAAIEAADQAQQAARDPKKALKKAGTAIAAAIVIMVVPVIAAVFIVVLVAVTFLAVISGAVEIGEAIPQDPLPIVGDGTGLVADYCIKIVVASPPYPGAPTDEGKCSQRFRELLEAAATWVKMPAGVLAGVAAIEGPQLFGYTDDEINDYSASSGGSGIGGQAIDPANSTPNGCSAIGPMQMTIDYDTDYPPYTFNCGSLSEPPFAWSTYKDAVNLAGVDTIANPDARNIINALYGAAWKLKCGSGTPVPECTGASFTKYDYDDPDRQWEGPPGPDGEADGTEGEVYRAARAYLGACVSLGREYCKEVWEYYIQTRDTSSIGAPWGWSTSGAITQGPYSVSGESHFEKSAIDIAFNGGGKPVYATQDGQMWKQDEPAGCGIYVVIFGTNYDSYYCHMEAYSPCLDALPNNSFIKTGTYLGKTGWTGLVEPKGPAGAHLHYAVKEKGSAKFIPLAEFNSLLPTYSVGDTVSASYTGSNCIQ